MYAIKYVTYNNYDFEQSYFGHFKKECRCVAQALANIKYISNVRLCSKSGAVLEIFEKHTD